MLSGKEEQDKEQRGGGTGAGEGEGEGEGGMEGKVEVVEKKCAKILMNLEKEFERVEMEDWENVGLVVESVSKANKEKFCCLARGYKKIKEVNI